MATPLRTRLYLSIHISINGISKALHRLHVSIWLRICLWKSRSPILSTQFRGKFKCQRDISLRILCGDDVNGGINLSDRGIGDCFFSCLSSDSQNFKEILTNLCSNLIILSNCKIFPAMDFGRKDGVFNKHPRVE